MNPAEYRRMFELEDTYWWFSARRSLALRLLEAYGSSSSRVLDLGCGTGAVLDQLSKRACAVGVDFSPLALEFARSREPFNCLLGDGTALPLQSDTFDAVVGLDVFEHIKDDQKAFEECFRVLRPGGVLILSVPAFKFLWGPHDIALHHFRRYRKNEAAEKLKSAGFEVVKSSYSVFLLFPIVVLIRILEKRKIQNAKASLPKLPGWMNQLLIGLQAWEASLLLRFSLPWGSSVIVAARKPSLDSNRQQD